jgi:hypothetical protein
MNLEVVDELLEDPDFAPLFVQDGFAVLCEARVLCRVGQEWGLVTAIERLEAEEGTCHPDYGVARSGRFKTSASSHSNSSEGIVVEAVVALGPFRTPLHVNENLDRLREGAKDLRECALEELRQALNSPYSPFDRKRAEFEMCRFPSGEAILQCLLMHLRVERGYVPNATAALNGPAVLGK